MTTGLIIVELPVQLYYYGEVKLAELLRGAIAQNDTQKTYLGLVGLQVSTQHKPFY